MVWDLHVDYCCEVIDVRLAKDEEGGWQVEEMVSGGHAEEMDESRTERLKERAKVLR